MNVQVVAAVLADSPGALVELCGVSMIERNLRLLQRLGFSAATIVNATREVAAALAKPSWARAKLQLHFSDPVAEQTTPVLVLRGDYYYDARLIDLLKKSPRAAFLIDSNPPSGMRALLSDAQRAGAAFVIQARISGAENEIAIDATTLDPYIGAIRRTLHPLWFPAPTRERIALAEDLIFDAAQKGTLDIPAIAHAPIETWITRRICRTRITPNQITLLSTFVAIGVTLLFAFGWWWSGAIAAAIFGVLDGVDGKLARVKVETSEIGQWEHELDHALEFSWWLALAYSLGRVGRLPHAWIFAALLIGGDLLGKLANRPVMFHTGKPSHDFGPFERRLRLVASRRNITIWMLLVGLMLGHVAIGYAAAACWSALTATINMLRAGYIIGFTPRQQAARASAMR